MKLQGFFQIGPQLVEGLALGDDGQVDTFGYIELFAFVDMDLDDFFHAHYIAFTQVKVN